jgi:XTP/dITP diphosphohydrolase
MRKADVLVLASTNRHKFEEFQVLFKKFPEVEIAPVDHFIRNAGKLSLVETANNYHDNALAKARTCNLGCHYPSLADDSGIEVDALQSKPGVHSHRFAIPRAGQTQDQANNQKLLDELKNISANQRTARFVCNLVLVMEGTLIQAVGILEGTIATELRPGREMQGFGYDPLFIPKGYDQTLSELGTEVKNKISHRAQAVQELMKEIRNQEIVFAKP